jgi:hypothetical protein
MPGLIWGSKGELLSGGAGVPDGSADGQFLLWSAAAGEWQAQSITPGDIGAAAAVHTHEWSDITSVGFFRTGVATEGNKNRSPGSLEDIAVLPKYSTAMLFLVEDANTTHYYSIHMLAMVAGPEPVEHMAGSLLGTVSLMSTGIVRYTVPTSNGVTLSWLFLPFGVR